MVTNEVLIGTGVIHVARIAHVTKTEVAELLQTQTVHGVWSLSAMKTDV